MTEPRIQPESETLPQQQHSEEERAAIERAWREIEAKRARAYSRVYWHGDEADLSRRLRDAERDANRVRD